MGELDSTVSVLSYDETDGSFHRITKSFYFTLLIMMRLMVVLQFVFLLMAVSFYASNRGHNSIAVYAVSENGEAIERIHQFQQKAIFQEISICDPSEDFVVVANQDSDNLTLYRRNQETGLLENDSKKMLPFPNVFVLFICIIKLTISLDTGRESDAK